MTRKIIYALIALLLAPTLALAQQYPSPTFNNATVTTLNGKSIPSGAFVGTTDTQTLTNKSISGEQINSGTVAIDRLPATVQTTDTVQTITGAKTFSSLLTANGGVAASTLRAGSAQSAIGQIGQVTSTYPAGSSDIFRVEVGGFPINGEFSNANPTSSAIVGAIMTPPGATSSVMSDVGVSGYARTNTTDRPAMGLFGSGGIGIAGASAWGVNTQPVNCENHATACGVDTGYDFGLIYGAESNVTIYSKAGGSAPSGSADGFVATASGNARPTGSNSGFHATRHDLFANNSWKYGFVTDDAAAQRGASIGSATTSASSASQELEFVSRDGSNVRQFSYMKTDASKRFNFDNDLVLNRSTNTAVTLLNSAAPKAWSVIATATGLQLFDDAMRFNLTSTLATMNTDVTIAGTLSAQNGLRIPFGTPASATAACTQGAVQFDAAFIYTCVATNTWRRVATATW